MDNTEDFAFGHARFDPLLHRADANVPQLCGTFEELNFFRAL